jgi:hypothetical protein
MFALQQLHVFCLIYYCVRRRKDTIAEKKNEITVDEVCEEAEPSAPVNVAETVALVGSIDSMEEGLGVRIGPAVFVGTSEGWFDKDGSADIDGNIETDGAVPAVFVGTSEDWFDKDGSADIDGNIERDGSVDCIPTNSDGARLLEGTLLMEEAIDSSVGWSGGVIVCVTGVIVGGEVFATGDPLRICKKFPLHQQQSIRMSPMNWCWYNWPLDQ